MPASTVIAITERELRWVGAWNDHHDLTIAHCRLPDHSIVDVEACKGWLQDSAYQGFEVSVEEGWNDGRRCSVEAQPFHSAPTCFLYAATTKSLNYVKVNR